MTVGGGGTDEELMAALRLGDDGALRVLYERHAAAMLRLLRRLTSSAAVAEEILQEAWLAAWQSAAHYRGEASVRAWLLGVARRRAHDRLRRRELPAADLDEALAVPDPGEDVEARVLAAADATEIAGAVAALPEHLREVVVLALVEELSYPDISVILGIPVGTVKSRMSHARRRLADALTRRGVTR